MRRYNLLIVSAQPKFNESLKELINGQRRYDFDLETSVSSAKRQRLDRAYDFVMINAPLPDDDGVRFAIDCSSDPSCASLLLIRSEYYSEIFEKVCPYGVYTLSKPSPKQMVELAFDWLESTRERLRKLEKRSVSLEDKMQEIRVVNRAKWLLISERGMTEEESHRFIEKLAMDRCITKRAVAEEIIKTSGGKQP